MSSCSQRQSQALQCRQLQLGLVAPVGHPPGCLRVTTDPRECPTGRSPAGRMGAQPLGMTRYCLADQLPTALWTYKIKEFDNRPLSDFSLLTQLIKLDRIPVVPDFARHYSPHPERTNMWVYLGQRQ